MTSERKSAEYMETLERLEANLEVALAVLDREDSLRLLHTMASRLGFDATPSAGRLLDWREQAEAALTEAKGNKLNAIKYFRAIEAVMQGHLQKSPLADQ